MAVLNGRLITSDVVANIAKLLIEVYYTLAVTIT